MKKPIRRIPSKSKASRAASSASNEASHSLSEEEKHALILAHAEARQGGLEYPGPRFYIAIVVSSLAVIGGWWMTMGATINASATQKPDPAIEALKQATQQLKVGFEAQSRGIKETVQEAGDSLQQAAKAGATSTPETVSAY